MITRATVSRLTPPLGVVLFVGLMSVGYYYNVTFVQLGLTDLGSRVLGLPRQAVANHMALLAVVTCASALASGLWMRSRGLGHDLRAKLRVALAVVAVQTLLTLLVGQVASEAAFVGWLVVAGAAIGAGVPATFGLAVHLVPTRQRGMAAALITAVAYFAAPVASGDWTVEFLATQMAWLMVPGALALAALALVETPFLAGLAEQHRDDAFRYGRYARPGPDGTFRVRGRLMVLVVLMFGVFFIDSLGFLRLVETPVYMLGAWQSPEMGPRLTIAIAHAVTALVAGVLYDALGERHLLGWVFGLFALVHLLYLLDARLPGDGGAVLTMPVVYAAAVSLYTVIAFAVWADLSTPDTITVNAALGVAASAWTATFLSTALALRWEAAGVPLETHLRWVEATSLLFFAAMLLLALFPPRRSRGAAVGEAER
jgi:MFS family permease